MACTNILELVITAHKLTIFGFVLAIIAAVIVIVDASNSTADAHFTPTTSGTGMEQLCIEPAFNLVSVAGVSLLGESDLIPPPHHNSYMPPPKCRKVKTTCKRWHYYTDTDSNGRPVTKKTCRAWNYRWECG